MRTTAIITICAALLAAAGAAGDPGAQKRPALRPVLISSSEQEVRFRVEFTPPQEVEELVEGQKQVHLRWSGVSLEGAPGGPAIPTGRVRIALPPLGDLDVSFTGEPGGTLHGARFPTVPWLREPRETSEGRPDFLLPRPGTGPDLETSPRPLPVVEIEDVSWERGLRIATVLVRPASWNARTAEATWMASLEVTMHIRGASSSPSRRLRPDPVAFAAWKHSLLNPDDAARFRTGGAQSPGCEGVPDLWFDDAETWVKIEVDRNGVFGLTRSTLESAGVPVSSIDPRTLRLYSGPLYPDVSWAGLGWDTLACLDEPVVPGKLHVYSTAAFCQGLADSGDFQEIAIWVRGEEDGSFDASDALVFYGLGPDNFRDRFGLPPAGEAYFVNPYTDRTVYWLTWDGLLPGSPLRMEAVTATPIPGDPEVQQTTGRVHAESNTFEDPSLYDMGLRWDRWFWERLSSSSGVMRFPVDLPRVVAGTSLNATVRFWGAKLPTNLDLGEAVLHHLQATVNGQDGGLHIWGGYLYAEAFSAHDITLLDMPARTPSLFTFLVPQVASQDPNRLDQIHLAWMDVTYRRDLELGGNPAELILEAGSGRRTLDLTGMPSGTPVVLDVSNFRRPRRLLGGTADGNNLAVSWDRGANGILAVSTESEWFSPVGILLDQKPMSAGSVRWLRDLAEPLDYVIITQEAWMPEAEVLAEWRRDHLGGITDSTRANVRVVSIADIMDEFSWGMWDPAALRYFLEYAYRFYGGAGTRPLSYALFLGDATNDPRNYGGSGSKDYVPSWEDNREDITFIYNGNTQYVSDDPLARFDDPGSNGCPDRITDLYLGRLPVSSRAEARDLIQGKVIRAEAPRPEDYGPWRTKAILVADDICQAGGPDPVGSGVHINQTEEASNSIPPAFELEKIYLYEYGKTCNIVTKPEAKSDLIASWSEGAWLVNYVGHGADVVWADEHVLDLSDTPLLTNDGRLPVVGSFSCSVGKFSNPTRDGLGEAHVRARRGGALVSAAATHLTFSSGNAYINYLFLQKLFPNGPTHPAPIGVALMEAKRTFPFQADKYVCLGDAASQLSTPREDLVMEGPARLNRGEQVEIDVIVPGGNGRTGFLSLEARDANLVVTELAYPYELPGAILYRGQTPVTADSASQSFIVPISLRGGTTGRVSAYAWGSDWDALAALSPLEVGGLATSGSDTTGPTITFPPTTSHVETGAPVLVALEDPSGINLTQLFEFRSILLKVTDRAGLEQLRQDITESFAYDLGSHTRGTLTFRVPDLPAGPYIFTISATDNFNNRSQTAAALEVGDDSVPLVFEGTHWAYPNPFDPDAEPTRLLFSLNRSADVTVRVYSVSGRLVRRADFPAPAGPSAFSWDGRDEEGDPVANGVYLVQLAAQRSESEEAARILERVVVVR